MLDLSQLEHQLANGKTLEEVLEKEDWKGFERTIAEIFRAHGFLVRQNLRFKTKGRYEIDVIAVRNNRIICLDCKWWGRGRYKKSGLRKAVAMQEARASEFKKFLNKNPIAKTALKIVPDYQVYPLVVTLHEEDMVNENETFVVPAWKLNSFLLRMEEYF